MDIHKNARLTPHSRAELVRRVVELGQTPKAVATAFGVCERTARKWVERFRREGLAGLADRSSRPRRLRSPTPDDLIERIEVFRRRRWTGRRIAATVGVSPATVSRVLKHIRTRPYTPRTNGKAELFIQTALREWAYAQAYENSDRRAEALPTWLHAYNWHRPHGSLKANTPISRLGLTEDNLLRLHI